jgi:lysozyme family protein
MNYPIEFLKLINNIIIKKEGPYSNLKNDIGKETCYGISRVYNDN